MFDIFAGNMVSRTIENIFCKLLPIERYAFKKYCKNLGLNLNYLQNKEGIRIFSEVFVKKSYAPWFPFYEGATIVDVGAHFGYFSMFAAMNIAPSGKVYAIEPSPKNYDQLCENLKANKFERILPIAVGLSNHRGFQPIYGDRSFNHSIFSSSAATAPIASVPLLSLADFMQQQQIRWIDFLKLDCEGAEYPILLESSTTTLNAVNVISLEFHDLRDQYYRPQQLVEHLEKNGFDIKTFAISPNYGGTRHNFGRLIAKRKPA